MTTTIPKIPKKKLTPDPGVEPEEPQEDNFRFIKLLNGEDILCTLEGITSELVIVKNPLKITTMFDPHLDEALYMFVPWLPFTEQPTVGINSSTIVTLTSVKDPVKEVYLKKVDNFTKHTMQQVVIPKHHEPPPETEVVIPDPTDEDLQEEEKKIKAEEKQKKAKIRVN